MKQALILTFTLISALWTSGCSHTEMPDKEHGVSPVKIVMETVMSMPGSRSADPDENRVSDMNLFIFNADGLMEEHVYLPVSQMQQDGTGYIYETDLLKGCRYSIYACANMGYRLDVSSIGELERYRYHLVYPDDYRIGIPMCGKTEDITVPAGGSISVPMERLMSKVTLSIDRSMLSDGVEFHVRQVKVGACPKSATLFEESRTESEDDIFLSGFSKEDEAVSILNSDRGFGKSGTVSVYLLENMHGNLLDGNVADQDKFFGEGDPLASLCSYIELAADYESDTHFSFPGQALKYRFYLGEENGNFDVRRNRHYKVCVKPEDDGLSEDSWRVDTGGIGKYVQEIRLSYSTLEMNYFGETAVLNAYVFPDDASDMTLLWESDNSHVAEVSGTGTVTARNEGVCTVTCRAADGSGVFAECDITVSLNPYYMNIYPGNYLRGKRGDKFHVFCEYYPPSATFDIGLEELEYDRERGVYDYVLDEDGKGVTLTLKEKGSGLLYMETGYPLNQSEMIVIVVD